MEIFLVVSSTYSVCVCVFMFLWKVYVYAYIWGTKVNHRHCASGAIHHVFARQGPSLSQEGEPAGQQTHGISLSLPLQSWDYNTSGISSPTQVLGLELKSSHLQGKHLTD